MTFFSQFTRSRKGVFWSASQKKRASLKRARSTRSLPWRMSPCGSPVGIQHGKKVRREFALGVFEAKYFWWSRITVTRTSSGKREKFSSKLPRMTDGNSVRLTTVSSSSLSSRQRAPGMVRQAASRALRMRCSRSAGIGTHGLRQVLFVRGGDRET